MAANKCNIMADNSKAGGEFMLLNDTKLRHINLSDKEQTKQCNNCVSMGDY